MTPKDRQNKLSPHSRRDSVEKIISELRNPVARSLYLAFGFLPDLPTFDLAAHRPLVADK